MPDGRTVPSIPPEYPGWALLHLRNSGEGPLTLEDWRKVQERLDGSGTGAPLWRLILADAHRERSNDLRKVTVGCATALDVAAQSLLPADEKFDMRLLQGKHPSVCIPDLRASDPVLYETLSRLWYTWLGVVHRGESNLYSQSPLSGAPPLRRLNPQDVEGFLIAVPQGVAYLEDHLT
jgi:hypothetical protein